MAVSRGTLEEAAVANESQANFFRSFVDFLKQHRPILHKLPEMFERFMDMESNQTSDTQNSDSSRIMQLESELKEKTLELKKLSKEKEESIASSRETYYKLQEQFKNSTDAYIKEIDALNGEKTDLMERISSLQNELISKDLEMVLINSNKDEQIQAYRDRFNKLKEQYEKATSRNDQELKELNFSYEELHQLIVTKDEQARKYAERNEDLTQQIRNKEDQVKEYEAKYKRLTQEYKTFLATKDEELKGIRTRNEDLTQQIRTKEDQVREYEANLERANGQIKSTGTWYNKLTEEYGGLLGNKDEELKGIKTRYMSMS